jgi:hypothetical protein
MLQDKVSQTVKLWTRTTFHCGHSWKPRMSSSRRDALAAVSHSVTVILLPNNPVSVYENWPQVAMRPKKEVARSRTAPSIIYW